MATRTNINDLAASRVTRYIANNRALCQPRTALCGEIGKVLAGNNGRNVWSASTLLPDGKWICFSAKLTKIGWIPLPANNVPGFIAKATDEQAVAFLTVVFDTARRNQK